MLNSNQQKKIRRVRSDFKVYGHLRWDIFKEIWERMVWTWDIIDAFVREFKCGKLSVMQSTAAAHRHWAKRPVSVDNHRVIISPKIVGEIQTKDAFTGSYR